MAAERSRRQPRRGVDKKDQERQREQERAELPGQLQRLVLASISPYRFGDLARFPPCQAHGASDVGC